MHDNEQGQQPNSAGVVEDPSQIPPAPPVHPESQEVPDSTFTPDPEGDAK